MATHSLQPERILAPLLVALTLGCGSDEGTPLERSGATPAEEGEPEEFVAAPGEDTDGDGYLDALEVTAGSAPTNSSRPCARKTYTLVPEREPGRADFILLLDTSGSMADELPLLRRGLLEYFTPLIRTGALDFTLTLIAEYGQLGADFCIPAGPQDTSCDDTRRPPVNERFAVYDQRVNSTDSLSILSDTMHTETSYGFEDGWYGRLREGSTPVFVELSDDDSLLDRRSFEDLLREQDRDARLYAADGSRKFVWHSVVGVLPPSGSLFWSPSAPKKEASCSTAFNAGEVYQELSILTGGLRFPVCEAVNYAAVLEQLAAPIVDGSYIPCTLGLPPSTNPDLKPDVEAFGMQLSLNQSSPELLWRIGGEVQCSERGYYLERSSFGQRSVILCPQLCAAIEDADYAELRVAAGCRRAASCPSPTHGCD